MSRRGRLLPSSPSCSLPVSNCTCVYKYHQSSGCVCIHMHKFCVCVPMCYMYVCICLYVCLFHTLTCSFRSACTPGSFSVSADIFIRKHWPPLLQQRTHSLLRSQRYVNMSAHEKETRSCITETAVFGISLRCMLAHLDLSPGSKKRVSANRLMRSQLESASTLGSLPSR